MICDKCGEDKPEAAFWDDRCLECAVGRPGCCAEIEGPNPYRAYMCGEPAFRLRRRLCNAPGGLRVFLVPCCEKHW